MSGLPNWYYDGCTIVVADAILKADDAYCVASNSGAHNSDAIVYVTSLGKFNSDDHEIRPSEATLKTYDEKVEKSKKWMAEQAEKWAKRTPKQIVVDMIDAAEGYGPMRNAHTAKNLKKVLTYIQDLEAQAA